jgi:hypothetical protein
VGRPGFLVHFASTHPLGRAHTLAAEGREGEARALVERITPQRRDLRGLCFDRFTSGGAEIVLVSCTELSGAASEAFQRRWASRFQSMAGVDYADPNSIADVEQRR